MLISFTCLTVSTSLVIVHLLLPLDLLFPLFNRLWLCGPPFKVPGRLRREIYMSGDPEVLVWYQGLHTRGTGYFTGRYHLTLELKHAGLLVGTCGVCFMLPKPNLCPQGGPVHLDFTTPAHRSVTQDIPLVSSKRKCINQSVCVLLIKAWVKSIWLIMDDE